MIVKDEPRGQKTPKSGRKENERRRFLIKLRRTVVLDILSTRKCSHWLFFVCVWEYWNSEDWILSALWWMSPPCEWSSVRSTACCSTLIQVICSCGCQHAPCSVLVVSDSSPGLAIVLMLSLSPAVSLLEHTVITRDTRSISRSYAPCVANLSVNNLILFKCWIGEANNNLMVVSCAVLVGNIEPS